MEIQTFYTDSEEGKRTIRETMSDDIYQRKNHSILVLCLSGTARFVYGDSERAIEKNTCIYITVGLSFKITDKSADYRSIVCFMPKESITEALFGDVIYHISRLAYRPRIFYLSDEMASVCCFLIERAHKSASSNLLFKDDIAACYIKILMFTALRLNISQSKSGSDSRSTIITDRYIEYARVDYHKTRMLKYYADKLNVTPKYLSSCVLKASGRHASEWLDDFTIHEIKQRLKNGNETLQQISYDLNFATPSHLSHYFKSKTGMTPREYLKIYRENSTPPPTEKN